ncbi:MAG: DNA-binding protein, partial [Roseburia faecis]
EKWGVTPRRVNYYCAGGRIPGAVKMATIWLIPKNAEKPVDRRRKENKSQ